MRREREENEPRHDQEDERHGRPLPPPARTGEDPRQDEEPGQGGEPAEGERKAGPGLEISPDPADNGGHAATRRGLPPQDACLVSAYTNRFTPMRSASSRSSGGSSWTSGSSQPLPRSDSWL